MRNLVLEVRSIRRCADGHTCNLIANGRKAAFVGPDIFEWSKHSQMVDVLEWYAAKSGAKLDDKPVKLKEGWERETPDYKSDHYEETQEKLIGWIKLHFFAYEIKERCKQFVLCLDALGDFYQFRFSEQALPGHLWKMIKISNWTCLNKLTLDEIVATLSSRKKLPTLPEAK